MSGTVLTSDTKEPALGALIKVKDSQLYAIADAQGDFRIESVPEGEITLLISLLGYSEDSLRITVLDKNDTWLGIIYLEVAPLTLKEVVVTPGSYSFIERMQSSASLVFSEKNIKNMAWAEDITRSVARLPGISSSDYSSKFAIRGGETDEVLITLDGMELYEPFHQRDYSGGLFSIVDIEAIRGVNLMTGAFSSVHGNRLSGVFDMRTKNALDRPESHISLGASVMNSRIYADGKFAGKNGSYLFSARRGLLDFSLKTLGNDEYFPKFYDGLMKVEYRLSDKNVISGHMLHAGDRAFINNSPEGDTYDQFNTKYNNTYTWLTLKTSYSEKVVSRTILYFGDIRQKRKGGFNKYDNSDKGYFGVDDRRNYQYAGIKQDWNWEALRNLQFNLGYEFKGVRAEYHHLDSLDEIRVNQDEELYHYSRQTKIILSPSGGQLYSYINTRVKILPKLFVESGIRYDHTSYTGDKNWSPRASMVYSLSRKTFVRAGWGHYFQSQFVNQIDVNNGVTTFYPARMAKHYVLSLEHQSKNGINLRLELYHKDYSQVSPIWQNLRDHLENYPEARNDNAQVILEGISAQGVEFFLKHDKGKKISWWFSYALAGAFDDVKDIRFDGLLIKRTGKVPRLNNQRHTIYADVNFRPSEKWHFSASFVFYNGWPRTDYTYRTQLLETGDIHFYQVHLEYNSTTYPAYHRLDLRVNRTFSLKNSHLTTFLHLVNAYNRENLKKFDLDTENDAGVLSLDMEGNYVPLEDNKYWLKLLPVIGMKWELEY